MNPYLRAAKTTAGKARMKSQAATAQQKRQGRPSTPGNSAGQGSGQSTPQGPAKPGKLA